ncbi:UDP-N-acetylmuramate dehydrogenase [Anaerorhabdus sp.]|uniref:UDP-N-acetylmuramate dehydrogenase n=1 Tax=Anaerorhabdus sp. TaxID=1872524 RepID=UPI002FC728CB
MEWDEFVEIKLKENKIYFLRDELIKNYTTLKIGGKAKYIIEVESIEDIEIVLDLVNQHEIPYLLLGNGSNVLFDDLGFDGIVMVLSKRFNKVYVEEDELVCDAGANLKRVCEIALENSLTGLEFAYGIPGSIGGAVYMNAGAFDGEIKDVVTEVYYIDKRGIITRELCKQEDFSYRKSKFTNRDGCILQARFKLAKGVQTQIKSKMDDLMTRRISKQPLEYPSAGSVFVRPTGNYASALIEQCGLKGKQIGGAMVSTKHAGFLVNYDNATYEEFTALIYHVQKEVAEQTGYSLECEIKIIKKE